MLVIADVWPVGPWEILRSLGFVFLLIAGVEALVLWRLKWGPFLPTLYISLAINFVSTLTSLGLFLGLNVFQIAIPYFLSQFTLPFLAWVIAVLIEGGLLALLAEYPARWTWIGTLATNTTSYLVLILWAMIIRWPF